jgi:hypothetical protein
MDLGQGRISLRGTLKNRNGDFGPPLGQEILSEGLVGSSRGGLKANNLLVAPCREVQVSVARLIDILRLLRFELLQHLKLLYDSRKFFFTPISFRQLQTHQGVFGLQLHGRLEFARRLREPAHGEQG